MMTNPTVPVAPNTSSYEKAALDRLAREHALRSDPKARWITWRVIVHARGAVLRVAFVSAHPGHAYTPYEISISL